MYDVYFMIESIYVYQLNNVYVYAIYVHTKQKQPQYTF